MLTNEQMLNRYIRALRTLSAGNHTLLRACNEQQLLDDMCHVIVEKGGYSLATVGYAENDEHKSIRWVAAAGNMETRLLETLRYNWADSSRSVTGMAIRTAKPCVARNILTDPDYDDPLYAPLRERATREGWAAVSAFPFVIEDEMAGALSMAAPEADAFDAEEVELLSELAADLAYGITNLRTRIKHREAEATIMRLAYYDELTGLPNRTLLHERTREAIEQAKQQHYSLALLCLQLNQFHEINDILGYQAGNELLRIFASRLAQATRQDELRARIGEAEFALLLPHAGASLASSQARRLLEIMHEPVEICGLTVHAPVRIGIALYPGHGMDAEALIRRANAAARSAGAGRDDCAIYAGGQEQENTRRLMLMGDLRRAIAKNELFLYCQPKVTIETRRICGAEALVRWKHPSRGMLSTGEFIKFAEHAALITPLTNWVLEAAFSQAYIWQEAGLSCPLSVNLSAQDLRDPGLTGRIRGLFSTWGVSPDLIEFELTESALMEDPESALRTLRHLKELNVKLYIDDFGTGYSSLSYLQKLPVDWIKIDQSFVMPMIGSTDSETIVRSTIELGHNLGLKVVAEGVSDSAIWERLATLGCDVAQGHAIAMAMPVDEFEKWMKDWSQEPAPPN
jgi:diguanylate cyclase (GGDEF)-like protein